MIRSVNLRNKYIKKMVYAELKQEDQMDYVSDKYLVVLS